MACKQDDMYRARPVYIHLLAWQAEGRGRRESAENVQKTEAGLQK